MVVLALLATPLFSEFVGGAERSLLVGNFKTAKRILRSEYGRVVHIFNGNCTSRVNVEKQLNDGGLNTAVGNGELPAYAFGDDPSTAESARSIFPG